LSKIRYILYSNEFCYKHLLEVALINISKDFSNDRKSTSKLHIKKDTDIDKIDSSLIFSKFLSYFLSITKAITDELNIYNRKGNINLLNENINKINNFIEKKSIDLIVTSPPYGDNKTTISYGQFSILPLL